MQSSDNPGHNMLRKSAPPLLPPFNVGYVQLTVAAVLQKLPNIEWEEGGGNSRASFLSAVTRRLNSMTTSVFLNNFVQDRRPSAIATYWLDRKASIYHVREPRSYMILTGGISCTPCSTKRTTLLHQRVIGNNWQASVNRRTKLSNHIMRSHQPFTVFYTGSLENRLISWHILRHTM